MSATSQRAQALAAAGVPVESIEAQLVREGHSVAQAKQAAASVKGWVSLPAAEPEPAAYRWSRWSGYGLVVLVLVGLALMSRGTHWRLLGGGVGAGLIGYLIRQWREG